LAVLLFGMPWPFALSLGFVLAAVSPAVVVPSLLELQIAGYGVAKGIPTLVLAAASLDDVLAISAFAMCAGIALSGATSGGGGGGGSSGDGGSGSGGIGEGEGTAWWLPLVLLPLQLVGGVVSGYITGALPGWMGGTLWPVADTEAAAAAAQERQALELSTAPQQQQEDRDQESAVIGSSSDRQHQEQDPATPEQQQPPPPPPPPQQQQKHRVVVLVMLLLSLALVFAASALKVAGAGYLAAMALPLFAGRWWGPERKKGVGGWLNFLWSYLQYFLFGLIGAAVDLSSISPETVGTCLVILCISLAVRIACTFAAVGGAGLSTKEKGFVSLAWLPKATVQAAIGGEILDGALQSGASAEVVEWGRTILTLAVLAIVVTAPIGSIAIAVSGPRWLQRGADSSAEAEAEAEVQAEQKPASASRMEI
jgi:NhaP-type Na+/H+ or K+/H+ antiporter